MYLLSSEKDSNYRLKMAAKCDVAQFTLANNWRAYSLKDYWCCLFHVCCNDSRCKIFRAVHRRLVYQCFHAPLPKRLVGLDLVSGKAKPQICHVKPFDYLGLSATQKEKRPLLFILVNAVTSLILYANFWNTLYIIYSFN